MSLSCFCGEFEVKPEGHRISLIIYHQGVCRVLYMASFGTTQKPDLVELMQQMALSPA